VFRDKQHNTAPSHLQLHAAVRQELGALYGPCVAGGADLELNVALKGPARPDGGAANGKRERERQGRHGKK